MSLLLNITNDRTNVKLFCQKRLETLCIVDTINNISSQTEQ